MSYKRTAKTLAKYRATMKRKARGEMLNKLNKPKNLTATAATMFDEDKVQAQAPQVDIRRVEEFNFRRGLVAAMECILREMR
jgi:hypothetical protein